MTNQELLQRAKNHYQQLAPHVKNRETAIIFLELIEALEKKESSNIINFCEKVKENWIIN